MFNMCRTVLQRRNLRQTRAQPRLSRTLLHERFDTLRAELQTLRWPRGRLSELSGSWSCQISVPLHRCTEYFKHYGATSPAWKRARTTSIRTSEASAGVAAGDATATGTIAAADAFAAGKRRTYKLF